MRRHLTFGPADIGTPQQQVGGDPHGKLGGSGGNRPGSDPSADVSRRRAEQNAQTMTRLPQSRVELREHCLGFGEAGLGLLDVEFRGESILEPFLCQFQRFLMNLDVHTGEFDPLLMPAQLHVTRGHVGNEQHLHVPTIFLRCSQLGLGRFDGAAVFAPKLDFPRRRQRANREEVEQRSQADGRQILADLGVTISSHGTRIG